MTTPNMITESGREDMSDEDRVSTLQADIDELLRTGPVHSWDKVNGGGPRNFEVHDFNQMIGYLRGTIRLIGDERPGQRAAGKVHLPYAECMAMAWKRGGLNEMRRIKIEQRDYKSRKVSK